MFFHNNFCSYYKNVFFSSSNYMSFKSQIKNIFQSSKSLTFIVKTLKKKSDSFFHDDDDDYHYQYILYIYLKLKTKHLIAIITMFFFLSNYL